MSSQPYHPSREGNQLTWYSNLQTKLPTYYGALDISLARQAKLTLVLNWLIWTWQTYVPNRRQDGPAATQWRNQLATGKADPAADAAPPVPPTLDPPLGTPFFGMLTWLFEEIARWKSSEGYTEIIGKDLGIVGAASQPHTDPPTLSVGSVAQNKVELLFNLYEHDGIWLESRVQGEADFSFLATDTASPYLDTRPVKTPGQAEWREYRACWWDHDSPTKQWGPVLRATVEG